MLKLPLLLKYVCLPDVMIIFFLQAEEISPEQEEKLWESGAFGAHSPRALRASLWYLTTKCLGMRGRQESRQLKWGDFTRKTDEWGNEFLEFNERTTKTRQGLGDTRPFHPKMWANCRNPERCPLYLYKEYERHRPYDMREPESPFYLGVNFKRAPSAECWFQRQPMGKNSLGTMMKVTAEKAGIKGKFTNHSTRRTSISQLMAHEVPPVVVAQLSGHKNIQSIMRYSTASRAQQEGMFKVLTNSGEYHNRALPSSAAAAPALHAALPQVSLLYMYVHVVLGLLGLEKKKKKNPCACSPRSPWFEKKKNHTISPD